MFCSSSCSPRRTGRVDLMVGGDGRDRLLLSNGPPGRLCPWSKENEASVLDVAAAEWNRDTVGSLTGHRYGERSNPSAEGGDVGGVVYTAADWGHCETR
jgi:hypothetical protein